MTKLYKNKESGLVVLTTSKDGNQYRGVVLDSGTTDLKIGTGLDSVNNESIVWDLSNFEVFDGIVELSNAKLAE